MVATTAHATPFTFSPSAQGQLGYSGGGVAAGFTNTSTGGVLGYNFVYDTAAMSKTPGAQGDSAPGLAGYVAMDNATTADSALTSGTGFGILALDADYQISAVNLTLTGLSDTATYALTFDFAEDQQLWSGEAPVGSTGSCGNSGGTLCDTNYQANLTVSQGASSDLIDGAANQTAQTFGGWESETFDFTTNASGTAVISFLASSPDGNVPAFALVDDINYAPVTPSPIPEPSSLMLLGTGLAGLGGFVRMRLKKATSL